MTVYHISHDDYLGYCVKDFKNRIVFAGSIEDCNDKCIQFNTLNIMCVDCIERGKSCEGTTCQTWTGCIYRKIK